MGPHYYIYNTDYLTTSYIFCVNNDSTHFLIAICPVIVICIYLYLLVASPAFFDYKEDGGSFPNPPSYNVATTLPSYDEAERTKVESAIPLVAGRVTVPRPPI